MKITISHRKKIILIPILFLLSNYLHSLGMDKIWLNDDTVLEGEITEITTPGKVVITLPWGEKPIVIRTEYIRRIEIMPRQTNISPNFMVGLTNGLIFPCNLLSIDKDNIKITTMDKEQSIPLSRVSSFSSLPEANCIFHGISNRWDLSKWEGQKEVWSANANGLQKNPFYNQNQTLIFPLTDKKTMSLLRFRELRGGTLLLARRKTSDGYNYLKLGMDLSDYPGYLLVMPEVADNISSPDEFYLPWDNLDLWILHHNGIVELFLEGVKFFSCSFPEGYEPIIGFTGGCYFSLYEMSIYSGATATRMNSIATPPKTRVLLTNNDVLSVQSLTFHNNSLLLEVYENTVKIPIQKISSVCFSRTINTEQKHAIEILLQGSIQSFAERIINLKNGCLIVQDKDGETYPMPCVTPMNIFISSNHTAYGASNILKTFTEAVIKKDFGVLNDIVISSVDIILSMFTEGLSEALQKLEITPVNNALLGNEALTKVNIRAQIANEGETAEEEILFIFRHKGRWYILIPSQ